jgi:nitrogenase subunit NifH
MASIWLLSKESMKGMDIVSIVTDALYAFEQSTVDNQAVSKKDIQEKFQSGSALLSMLIKAVRRQTEKGKRVDLFMLKIVESLEKSMGISPTNLIKKIEEAKKELQSFKVSTETINLFEKISQAVMNMTSRSVEEISTSLR